MSQTTIELHLPLALYQRARHIAQQSQRPLEAVLVDSLGLLFGTESAAHLTVDELPHYTDEQLWAVVHCRLTPTQEARAEALITQGKESVLSDPEQQELALLLALADHYMVLRAESLVLLQARGQDIRAYTERSR